MSDLQPRPPKVLTKAELDEIYFEAEYKLQNCIRVTLNVETYVTEVRATKNMWVPVTDYVLGLIEYLKDKQPRKYWVTNKDRPLENQRVLGPFTTAADAGVARYYIESKSGDHTFWIEELDS